MDVHNKTIVCDINHLNEAEIKEEYLRLTIAYNTLKEKNENDLQKIYELERNLETKSAAESYLTTELELITTTHATEIQSLNNKWQASIEELKLQNKDLRETNCNLDNECEMLRKETDHLKKKITSISDETQNRNIAPPKLVGPSEMEIQLEKENKQLLDLNTELTDKYDQQSKHLQMLEAQLNDMQEKVSCLADTLQSKREELEEKDVCIETLHSQLIELNAELAALKNVPEDNNRKGNSLFAEVDDQRQKMKSLLAAQKKHYLQMKLVYNESERTIRHLKRENAAFCKEIEKCTSIFLNADKFYKEKLYERISEKTKEIEMLENKLKWTENELIKAANGNGMKCVDSLFSFCKNETDNYKKQLQHCCVQKILIEDNFNNSQEELAKWRLEAIKSRWIIAKMEALLEDNGIEYSKAKQIDVPDKELKDAKPNILVAIKIEESKIDDHKSYAKKDALEENDSNKKVIIPDKMLEDVKESIVSEKEIIVTASDQNVAIDKPFKTVQNIYDVDVMNDDEIAAIIDTLCVTRKEIISETNNDTNVSKIDNIHNNSTQEMETELNKKIFENKELPAVSLSTNSNKISPKNDGFLNDIEIMNDDELAAIIDRICVPANKNISENINNDILLQSESACQGSDSIETTKISQMQEDNKENESLIEQQLDCTIDDSVQLLSKYRDISLNSHLTEKKIKSQQKIEQRITKYMNGPKLNKISPPPTSILSRNKDGLPTFLKDKKTVNFSDKLEASTSENTEEELKETNINHNNNTKKIIVKRIFIPSLKKK